MKREWLRWIGLLFVLVGAWSGYWRTAVAGVICYVAFVATNWVHEREGTP